MYRTFALFVLITCCCVSGFANDTIKPEELPEKVKTTLTKHMKGGELTSIEKIKNDAGKTVFACHIKMKNKSERILLINAKGGLEDRGTGSEDKKSDKEKEEEKRREKEIAERLRRLRKKARDNGVIRVGNPN